MNFKNLICILIFCNGIIIPSAKSAYKYNSMIISQTVDDTSTQLTEIANLREKYQLSSPQATNEEIETAKRQMKLYQLKRINDTNVNGIFPCENITLQQVRNLAKTVRAMATAARINREQSQKEFFLLLDFLFSQNIIEKLPKFKYSNYTDVRNVPADLLSSLPMCDYKRKIRLITAVQNLLEAEQLHLTPEDIKTRINSDYIYNVIPHLFICAIHNPNDEMAAKDLTAFSHFLSACTQYSPSGYDMLKPDGTGFHHNSHYNGYMYSFKTWVEYAGKLKGTSFHIEKEAYLRMRKAVVSEYLMAVRSYSDNHRIFGNSMAGRHPFSGTEIAFTRELFETMIEIGGDLEGIPNDLKLASYYNYFYKSNKYPDAPSLNADGFYQFNFSAAGIYRKDNWVAVMRCPTTNLWGSELYSKQNRFGRYQSHGTLEIIYEGGLATSGYPANNPKRGAGWDWNMMPGSTTVHYTDWQKLMPGQNDIDRFDQKSSTTNFAGALAWKDCGLFGATFDQDDRWGNLRYEPTNLKFCKSVFAINGMLFSIGTNIESKGNYPNDYITATNVFQSVISKNSKNLIVNGKVLEKGKEQVILPQQPVWMTTPTTTGYYIPKGHDKLVISHKEQTTPSSAGMASGMNKETISKGYIEHGVKPSKSAYQFLVVPAVTPERMKKIAQKQETERLFKVLAKHDSLHIIKHIPTSTVAYTLFAPATRLTYGAVYASSTEILIIERLDSNKLELAICNPNLRPKVLRKNYWIPTATPMHIELKGLWDVKTCNGNTKIATEHHSKGYTILKGKLTEGAPIYVTLEKQDL